MSLELGLVLKDFQEPIPELLVKKGRCILGMDPGLGKTPVSIRALQLLDATDDLDSLIIITTKRSMVGWIRMLRVWYPTLMKKLVVIGGSPTNRKQQWKRRPEFIMVTPQTLANDEKKGLVTRMGYKAIIIDEYHRFMRNRDTNAHKVIKRLSSIYLWMLSGSWASRGAQDFWICMNLINPKLFSSYWKWVNTFCFVDDGIYGKDVYGTRNVEQLQNVLRKHAIIITKKDIGHDKKIRAIGAAEMTSKQETMYKKMTSSMIVDLENGQGDLLVMRNPLDRIVKIRQLLCCPEILFPDLGIGGGLEWILDELEDYLDPSNKSDLRPIHSVIYVPFVKAIPVIQRELRLRFGDVSITTIQGGMSIEELTEATEKFRREKGIAIVSILSAESFDLETTDKGFFLGYDWDPGVNKQAEDRIDRIINEHDVLNFWYIQMQGTVDVVLEVLHIKQVNLNTVLNDPKRMSQLLRGDLDALPTGD